MAKLTFERIEQKYLLSKEQYQGVLDYFKGRIAPDDYGKHTICNIYYDTDNFALVRASIEKPVYKEKLRMRSYGIPNERSTVFVELKKKFNKTVYKRREALPYSQAIGYLNRGIPLEQKNQITQELDYFMNSYHPVPAAFISYDRVAYAGIADPELRVTFDKNILGRGSTLDLQKGIWGTPLLQRGEVLMEIKITGALPLEFSQELSCLEIYPNSFSKYGNWYKNHRPTKIELGGIFCV